MRLSSMHLQYLVKAGLGEATSILGTVGIGTVNVIVTIIAVFIADKIDRKKLLVTGNIGMIASLLIMAILIWTIGIESSAIIIIICLSLFIVFFGLTWGLFFGLCYQKCSQCEREVQRQVWLL